MDHLKTDIFSLTKEEKAECDAQGIPNYYWYIQKTNEQKIKIKKFIKQRVRHISSTAKLNILVTGIIKKLRELVLLYYDGKGCKIEKLNKEFNSEISLLIDKITAVRKPKAKIGPKTKNKKIPKTAKTSGFISLCGKYIKKELNPVFAIKGNAKVDKDCMYFNGCIDFAKNNHGRLDCSACELHETLLELDGED